MERASSFPDEKEVLLRQGLTFKIVNKSYKNILFTSGKFPIQKLVFELVIDGDQLAEDYVKNNLNIPQNFESDGVNQTNDRNNPYNSHSETITKNPNNRSEELSLLNDENKKNEKLPDTYSR